MLAREGPQDAAALQVEIVGLIVFLGMFS